MLGSEVNQPADLIYGLREEGIGPNLGHEQYVHELGESIRMAHEVARSKLKTTQERMKRDYDLRVNVHSYQVGDCIFSRISNNKG